jgi:preprotein translocase subunit YajC
MPTPFLPLAQAGEANAWSQFGLYALIFGIFYFMLIRPMMRDKRRAEEAQKSTQEALARGQRVQTLSGVIARVQTVRDKEVVLDLDGTARMTVSRDSVLRILDQKASTDAAEKQDKVMN